MSRKQNLKNRFNFFWNNFIEDKTDMRTAIERVEGFIKQYYITISENADDYIEGHHNKKRLIIVLITRLILIYQTLRFFILLLTKSDSVSIVLYQIAYMLAQTQMVLATGLLGSMGILIIGLTVTYQEMTNTLYTYGLINGVKHNLLPFPLNLNHQRRIAIASNLIGIYIMRPSFYIFMVLYCGFHLIYSLIFYSTLEEKLFSALYLIINNILFIIFCIQLLCMIWCGFIMWFATTTYCKYKFNEINKKRMMPISL